MYFNKDGYSKHCKDYREYWEWVNNRNPERYKMNIENKHNYDGKNLMHCFRLLYQGLEIAREGTFNPTCSGKVRELLLRIRRGEPEYDYLINKAEEYIELMDKEYEKCSLPTSVSSELIDDILLEWRNINL